LGQVTLININRECQVCVAHMEFSPELGGNFVRSHMSISWLHCL